MPMRCTWIYAIWLRGSLTGKIRNNYAGERISDTRDEYAAAELRECDLYAFRSGGRVAYGKPINFAGMKKICMFVASYIQSGRVFCLFVAGIFYALTLHIHGFVPPCGALMRPLPLWCRTTGKAEPFFISARQTFSVMSNTREKCLNGKITPRSNRPAHDTSESIYSKFLIEKQAKNQAYGYILSQGLLRDYIAYSRGESCSLESVDERLEMVLKNF